MPSLVRLLALTLLVARPAAPAHLQCVVCEPDTYCFQDASALFPDHSSSPQGSGSIVDCVCDAEHYVDANECRPCPSGSYCAAESRTM